MGRKKKYENALIAKEILSRECMVMDDIRGSLMFRVLDLKKEDDRTFLKKNVEWMIELFTNAKKELED